MLQHLKTIPFLFGIFLSPVSFSEEGTAKGLSIQTVLKGASCKAEILRVLQQWKSTDRWKKEPYGDNQFKYYTETEKFGSWIALRFDANEVTELEKVNSQDTLKFIFNKKNCNPNLKILKAETLSRDNELGDAELQQKILKNRNGIIYSWSPAMPFSIQGVDEAIKASKNLNINIIVFLDRNANLKEAKTISEKNNWPSEYTNRSNSVELSFRKMQNHFPSAIFFKDGKICPFVVPGFKTASSYEREYGNLK